MPYPPKITDEKNSDHSFLYPNDRQHKNIPGKIVNPLVSTFSTEMSLIFYCLFQIFRPSRKLFRDITLYCKAAVSIELIDIISLVLKYIYVYHLILNIFLEITSKHICQYYFFKKRYLTRVNREKPIRRPNSVNISLFDWSSLAKHGNKTINPLRYRTISVFHEHEQNTNMQSCDDYVKCKMSLVLICCNSKLEFKETKVLS